MNFRSQVYSPIQHYALWLGAWLYHQVPFDALATAFRELGGNHSLADDTDEGLVGLCKTLRQAQGGRSAQEPPLEILLHGPGAAVGLPPTAEITGHAASAEGAIVFVQDVQSPLVLVPTAPDTTWHIATLDQAIAPRAFLTPGEADAALTAALNDAAAWVDAQNLPYLDMPKIRMTVGTLSDFYETPGLPPMIAPRAAKLIARADYAAAIVETVLDRLAEHSFDPALLSISRHIRQARMTAVSYAVFEWGRRAEG